MTKRLWVWREVVPNGKPGDYYENMEKLTQTGRAFVMRSADETGRGATEIIGVFDSYEAAMKMVEIGNEG